MFFQKRRNQLEAWLYDTSALKETSKLCLLKDLGYRNDRWAGRTKNMYFHGMHNPSMPETIAKKLLYGHLTLEQYKTWIHEGYIEEVTPKGRIIRIPFHIDGYCGRGVYYWHLEGECWLVQNIYIKYRRSRNSLLRDNPPSDVALTYLIALRMDEDEFARITCGRPGYGECLDKQLNLSSYYNDYSPDPLY